MTLKEFAWKYKWLIILLIALPIFPVLVFTVGDWAFHIINIKVEDLIGYSAASLGYFGTVFLGILAFWQNEKLNNLNNKLINRDREKSFPFLDIISINSFNEFKEYSLDNLFSIDFQSGFANFNEDHTLNVYNEGYHVLVYLIKNIKPNDIISIVPESVVIFTSYNNEEKVPIESDFMSYSLATGRLNGNQIIPFVITGIDTVAYPPGKGNDELYDEGYIMPILNLHFKFSLINHEGKEFIQEIHLQSFSEVNSDHGIYFPIISKKEFISLKESSSND